MERGAATKYYPGLLLEDPKRQRLWQHYHCTAEALQHTPPAIHTGTSRSRGTLPSCITHEVLSYSLPLGWGPSPHGHLYRTHIAQSTCMQSTAMLHTHACNIHCETSSFPGLLERGLAARVGLTTIIIIIHHTLTTNGFPVGGFINQTVPLVQNTQLR